MNCNFTSTTRNTTIGLYAAALATLALGPNALAATRVRVASPAERTFESRLTVQGTVEAKTSANVAARVSGNLDTIWVDEGDHVVAGETRLFQIDPVNLSNQVVIAEQALAVAKSSLSVSMANLEKIKAEATKAERDYARYERLHREGRVTDNEFEVRETQQLSAKAGLSVGEAQIELAKQQVEQANAQLLIARKALSDTLIIAPLTGAVSVRKADPGEFIGAGSSVLTIVNTEDLEAAAFIPAKYYPEVKTGATAVRIVVNGKEADCQVSYKSPVVNKTLRTFEIKGSLSAETAADIAPGMMVDMTIIFEAHKNPAVPASAVLTRNGATVVFVAKDGKAVQKTVTVGLQNDGYAEITSGLDAADKVICEGHTLVREGMEVDIVD